MAGVTFLLYGIDTYNFYYATLIFLNFVVVHNKQFKVNFLMLVLIALLSSGSTNNKFIQIKLL